MKTARCFAHAAKAAFALAGALAVAGAPAQQNAPPAAAVVRSDSLPDFTPLVKKVGPAVVNVTTTTTRASPFAGGPTGDPLFEYFRRFMPMPPQGEGREFQSRGVGSGFVIDSSGLIMTNAHVVADADEVTVRLADSNREFKAKVIGSDPPTDIALIKVEATGLPVAPLGNSRELQPGEWVAAIGSPFGFANTITAGIVSATERALPDETYVPYIQTDVAVNPGNSGGPLINMRGEVVGINSQIYSRSGGYMGVSFAIPISVAQDIAQQLRTEGKVTRGRLGIGIQEVTPDLARSFNLDRARGALVTRVEPGSPASKAGLASGDVILRFGDKPVPGATELPRIVGTTKPGTTVPIEVWRDGASKTLSATIGEMPTETVAQAGGQGGEQGRLGVTVSPLPQAQQRELGVDFGVVVEDVRNPRTPLQPGDIILAINGQRFSSVDDFEQRLDKVDSGKPVALLVQRGEASLYVAAPVG
jgi:serine protease Do